MIDAIGKKPVINWLEVFTRFLMAVAALLQAVQAVAHLLH